jgi:hypothetical protein
MRNFFPVPGCLLGRSALSTKKRAPGSRAEALARVHSAPQSALIKRVLRAAARNTRPMNSFVSKRYPIGKGEENPPRPSSSSCGNTPRSNVPAFNQVVILDCRVTEALRFLFHVTGVWRGCECGHVGQCCQSILHIPTQSVQLEAQLDQLPHFIHEAGRHHQGACSWYNLWLYQSIHQSLCRSHVYAALKISWHMKPFWSSYDAAEDQPSNSNLEAFSF